MKRLFSIIALLAFSLTAASASNGITIEKNYSYKDFRGLAISNTFDVSVEKSDRYSVNVAVLDEYAPYLDIKVNGGILYIGFKNLPKKLSTTSYIKSAAVAKVSMPALERLSLSGASKCTSDDRFDINDSYFQMSVSGASEVGRIEVYGGDARIKVSGASRVNVAGGFVDVEIEVSGTSRATFKAAGEDLDVKTSGTGVADIEGKYDEMTLTASGASNITVKGSAGDLEVKASGAASVDAINAPVRSAEVSLSGASVCKTAVTEELEAECTGASTLSYKADGRIELELKEIARSATLKKL